MYISAPLAPTAGVAATLAAADGVTGLPDTGAPKLLVLLVLALILLLCGGLLVSRWLLRGIVVAAIGSFAAWTVALGGVRHPWDGVGLAVAVFTLAYGSMALRNLLPADAPRARSPYRQPPLAGRTRSSPS
jgi:hypothetical protein